MERLGIRLPLLTILLVPGSAWAQERVYEVSTGTVFGIRWLVAQGRVRLQNVPLG